MSLTKLTADVENIQALSDKPNEVEGLTPDQLKKKFDDAAIDIKQYINETITVELDTLLTLANQSEAETGTDTAKLMTPATTKQSITYNSNPNSLIPLGATLTFSSADAPNYVVSTSIDLTGIIGLGDKFKLTHGGVAKWFIVVAITSNSITLYGGTDYTLAATEITLPYYSHAKSPLGFPLNPDKWTITVTDTTLRSQTSPTGDAWYNLGGLYIDVPIGSWKEVSYSVSAASTRASAGPLNLRTTLSTANNSASDASMTRSMQTDGLTQCGYFSMYAVRPLTLTSKTRYYLNTLTSSGNGIYNGNNNQNLVLKAVSAYI